MNDPTFGFGKDALTTGEVAQVCNVAARTVSKWIDSGRLQGYRIPGSRDRRVHVTALRAFVEAHGIPVAAPAARAGAVPGAASRTRVLVVDADRSATQVLRGVLEDLGTFEVAVAGDILGAAFAAGLSAPDVVLFDRSAGDAAAFAAFARRTPALSSARLVLSGAADSARPAPARDGWHARLAKPYAVRTLVEAIEAGSRPSLCCATHADRALTA
jgi:excisionase family DNA binding protein